MMWLQVQECKQKPKLGRSLEEFSFSGFEGVGPCRQFNFNLLITINKIITFYPLFSFVIDIFFMVTIGNTANLKIELRPGISFLGRENFSPPLRSFKWTLLIPLETQRALGISGDKEGPQVSSVENCKFTPGALSLTLGR